MVKGESKGGETHEVDDLPSLHQRVKGLHHLGNGGSIVPVMDVEQVDIVGAQPLERGLQANVQGFGVVARIEDLLVNGGVQLGAAATVLERCI